MLSSVNIGLFVKNSPYPKQSYSSPDNNNSQSAINHYNPGANLKDMDHQAILQNDNPNQVDTLSCIFISSNVMLMCNM